MNLLAFELGAPELIPKRPQNPISWFEIPVSDMNRAVNFYQQVSGLKLENRSQGSDEMYFFPSHDAGRGASGSLVNVKDNKPFSTGTLIYFYTNNLNRSIALVKRAGGKVIKKEDIGKYGIYIHVIDTEGNRIGIHEER